MQRRRSLRSGSRFGPSVFGRDWRDMFRYKAIPDSGIAKELGVEAEYISPDPASCAEYAATGKVDMILANLAVAEECAQQVDFALPYMKVMPGVVSPEGSAVTEFGQLSGKKLTVVKGTTAEIYFEKNCPAAELLKHDE